MKTSKNLFALILCLLALATGAPSVPAQNPITFNFTGVIASVDDALGWFQDTYEVGATVTGSYTFFDSNYLTAVDFIDPDHSVKYQYYFKPNVPGVPLTNPDFRLKAGDREIRKDTSPLGWDFFWIPTWNDSAQSFPGPGDGYGVTSAIGFPSFWRDFSGDPVMDPDGFFVPLPIATLRLHDPTSNALNSVALSLMPPNLAAFSERIGSIVILDGNGEADYATAQFQITSLTRAGTAVETFATLHDFAGAPTDGRYPSGLTSSAGKLYGTTVFGGSSDSGMLFSMNIDGTGFTNLHSFVASEGILPQAGVIVSGNSLYGAAVLGGNADSGTVFTINTNGTGLTVLHHFAAFAPDPGNFDSSTNSEGIGPSTLILSGSTLYGTALEGGRWGQGTVFKLNTNGGGFTNLHNFSARKVENPSTSSDGGHPSSLILSGNTLYGTAPAGGSAANGTLFSVNTDGTGFMNLHNFSSTLGSTNSDGSRPSSKLSISGNTLFGTAQEGGALGHGTVFSVQTDGTGFKVLHHFSRPSGWPHSGVNSDGVSPTSLVLSGNTLYGATANGGSMGWGTIFAVNADGGNFRTLHNFPTPETNSHATYIEDLIVSGNSLYGAGGTTRLEGGVSDGMVFRLTLPGPPQLALIRSGASVVLSWPTNAVGFTLQSATNLVPPAVWSTVSPAPVVVNGQHTVTNPVSGLQKFYRLSD